MVPFSSLKLNLYIKFQPLKRLWNNNKQYLKNKLMMGRYNYERKAFAYTIIEKGFPAFPAFTSGKGIYFRSFTANFSKNPIPCYPRRQCNIWLNLHNTPRFVALSNVRIRRASEICCALQLEKLGEKLYQNYKKKIFRHQHKTTECSRIKNQ